ncbi:formylglycine-generating enzyme family protein [Rhodospirillum sp. A1_3_36]|uniref:formylglycine-generating enzyme family protein n=1 Tax=Rhodospirillum sp. A1_3_36 TaxID=3391666 RepID=UPI0039A4E1ED
MTGKGRRGRADLARALSPLSADEEKNRRLATLLGFDRGQVETPLDPSAFLDLGGGTESEERDPASVVIHATPSVHQIPFLLPWRFTALDHTEEEQEADTPDDGEPTPFVAWTDKPKGLPPCPVLRPWRSLAPLLRRLIIPDRETWEVDVPRLVERIAKGRSLESPPRRHRAVGPKRLFVVRDRDPRLIPLWDDQDALIRGLPSLFPHTEITVVRREPGSERYFEGRGDEVIPRDDQTPWLVLGDLGALTGADIAPWIRLARDLSPGCAIALTPMGREEADPRLRSLWRIEPWEEVLDVDDAVGGERQGLARHLLTLLSPAMGFSPGMMRVMRRRLLPRADIAVEIAAWNDPALEVQSAILTCLTREEAARGWDLFENGVTDQEKSDALAVIRSWRSGMDRSQVAEDFWFTELLNLSPRTRALVTAAYPEDVKCAEAFFLTLAHRQRFGRDALGDGPLAWLAVMGDRAPTACKVSDAFWNAVRHVKANDPDYIPPPGRTFALGDGMTAIDRIFVTQVGMDLLCGVNAPTEGSLIAVLPSDTGVLDVEAWDDGWEEVWGAEGVPDWVEDFGTDDHGRWCRFSYKGVSQTLRWCPPGRFLMGSPENESGRRRESEQSQVEITFTEGFWLFDTTVTQALYEAVMGENPSAFSEDGAQRPVEQVSRGAAQAFLERLNGEFSGLFFTLPSEAQWEYACRAGSNTPFEPTVAAKHKGVDLTAEEANFDSKRKGTVPVSGAPFRPNAWGLWHMHGNVWEWCADIWSADHRGADPFGKPRWESGKGGRDRVVRGGSWVDPAQVCRSAIRYGYLPDVRNYDFGFRPAGGLLASSSRPGDGPEGRGLDPGTADKPEASAVRGSGRRAERGSSLERARISPDKETRLARPAAPFILRTDRAELVFQRKTLAEMPWASAVGRDRFGLWSELTVEGVTQRLRWCPPGRFLMGSPAEEPGRYDDEGPQTDICISEGFWLFDTPVTQALYETVMGNNPSKFRSPLRPVEQVSWEDAQAFLTRLNGEISGLSLTLPSEAQWEYACRAGTREATYAGPMIIEGEHNAPILEDIAWYGGNSGVGFELANGVDSSDWDKKAHDHQSAGTRLVKGKRPNPWGLYDMLGNVWEWCADLWSGGYGGADPFGKPRLESGKGERHRVVRGGSWDDPARSCRSAIRDWFLPDFRYFNLGFRPAGGHGQSSSKPGDGPEGLGLDPGTADQPEASAVRGSGRRAKRGDARWDKFRSLFAWGKRNRNAD